MMKQKYIYISALSFLLMGCSDDTMYVGGVADYQPGMVRLQAEIDQVNVTRADDSGFADGDRIGVFAVSFTEDMNPGFLAPTGNLADNVRFTFNESSYSWKGDRELYFLDDKTPVDFYGCYPYNPSVGMASADTRLPISSGPRHRRYFHQTHMSILCSNTFFPLSRSLCLKVSHLMTESGLLLTRM